MEKADIKAIIIIDENNQTVGKNKPMALASLWGLSLIERSLDVLEEVGLDDFLIICGSNYDVIQRHVKSRKLDTRFNLALWRDFEDIQPEENKILVLTSNLMFDTKLIEELLIKADGNLTVCVDSSPRYVNLDQDLPEEFSSPGIFLCNGADLPAVKSLVHLNTIPQKVIDNTKMRVHDLKSSYWYRINTRHDLKMAERAFLNKNMSYVEHEALGMTLARRLSARFVLRYLVRTPLTPNMVSLVSFLLLFVAASLFSFGEYLYSIIGALVLLLALSLDYCDGMLARLKFSPSRFGAWLEDVLATVSFNAVVFGATLGMFNRAGNVLPWFIGIAAMILVSLRFIMNTQYKQIFGHEVSSLVISKGILGRINNLCQMVARPYLLILIGALANIMLYSFGVLILAMGIPMLIFFFSVIKRKS